MLIMRTDALWFQDKRARMMLIGTFFVRRYVLQPIFAFISHYIGLDEHINPVAYLAG